MVYVTRVSFVPGIKKNPINIGLKRPVNPQLKDCFDSQVIIYKTCWLTSSVPSNVPI